MAEEQAHLLLADISGYTGFIKANQETLNHAAHIVSSLLEAMVDSAVRPMVANKIEGDAVLFVGFGGNDAGEAAHRSIKSLFRAFDERRSQLLAANTCPCEACMTMGKLELKILAHKGELVRQKVGRFDEIAGLPVVVLHRLAKNSVDADRYLLATEEAWPDVAPHPDAEAQSLVEHCEGVGPVAVKVVLDPICTVEHAPKRAGWIKRLGDLTIKTALAMPLLGNVMLRRQKGHIHSLCGS